MPRPTSSRAAAVTAVVAAVLCWSPGSQAAPAAAAAADLGAVTCSGEQGRFDVSVTGGDTDGSLEVFVEDSFGQPAAVEDKDLAAHEDLVVTIADLADDDYKVSATFFDDDSERVLIDREPATVACDSAPTGPYTNPRAAVDTGCFQDQARLQATNKPIGGNTADLQPATFTVTYQPEEQPGEVTEEPGDDPGTDPGDDPGTDPGDDPGTDPGDEEPGDDADAPRRAALDPVVLDTFTLDLATPTLVKTYTLADGGEFYGTITVTVGDRVVATGSGVCEVSATSGSGTGGAGLPNTGA